MHLYHTMDNIPFPDQHMLEWHSTVERTGGGGGVVPFQVDLFFKNWTEGMNRYQLFAYKDVGAAVLSTDVVLLEFRRDATFLEGTWDGGLWWAGGDASAATDLAVVRSGLVSP